MKPVAAFREYLSLLGYQKSSIQMLPALLSDFLTFTGKPFLATESADIKQFYEYLQQRPNKLKAGGLSESYIHHHMFSLRLFFGWQQELGRMEDNPISSLYFSKSSQASRDILTLNEAYDLYATCENHLERAVLSLFYGCGLRCTEGVQLDLRDLHFRDNLLYVRSGKGGYRRAVPMSEKVKSSLELYVYQERISLPNERAVLCNSKGGRMSGKSGNTLLKKLIERSGIQKNITLHSLRHSIATHLLENGLTVEYVRDFLGHKCLESTQLYTHVDKKIL